MYAQDFEQEPLVTTDGEELSLLDVWCYCKYFAEHIQQRWDNTPDGIHLYDYADQQERDQRAFMVKLLEFTRDGRLCEYQEMMERHGVKVNGLALCNLCMFVIEIIRSRIAIMLRPRVCDTLEEIDAAGEPVQLELTTEDGKRISTDNRRLVNAVVKLVRDMSNDEQEYEVGRLTRRNQVVTKEASQVEFFYFMEYFLHDYFPIKRGLRGNAKLLPEEYQMIGYWMKWFGLSPVEVTPERMRQLRMRVTDVLSSISCFTLPIGENKSVTLQGNILKYVDWRAGRINPLKKSVGTMQEGDTLSFTDPKSEL